MRGLSVVLLILMPFSSFADVVEPIKSVQNHVNVRMSADAKSEVVGKLQQGTTLRHIGSIPGWHEVEIAGGATGFISAEWSNVVSDSSEAVAESSAEESQPDEKLQVADTATKSDDEPQASNDEAIETVPELLASQEDADNAPDDGSVTIQAEQDNLAALVEEVAVNPAVVEVESAPAQPEEKLASLEVDVEPAEPDDVVVAVTNDDIVETNKPALKDDTAESATESMAAVVDEVVAEQEEVVAEQNISVESPASEPTQNAVAGLRGPRGEPGPPGPAGPAGPQGPTGSGGDSSIEGSVDYLMKFSAPTVGANSQVYDDGNNVGIGTTDPKQRLEVNGNIQIHEQNSSVAGLMITQSSGETGYIMHNMASTLTIGAGSIDRITINRNGDVGIGVSRPSQPIEMASGAYVSAGGVWTNSSSRARKENIAELTSEQAMGALAQLNPVEFNYKNDQQEKYIGFIAEDVPDLVATTDRQSLSTMDIVAVLTKVVQEQQKKISELEARLEQR